MSQRKFIKEKKSNVTLMNYYGDLPCEIESGNVEYKLQLLDKKPQKFERMVSQLKWRVAEGHGEALYFIGVADNGQLVGLSSQNLRSSLLNLQKMATSANAEVIKVFTRTVKNGSFIAEVEIHENIGEDKFVDFHVGIFGLSDSGKSTLMSVLTHSVLDNGHGSARPLSFNHVHELHSGHTSSLSFRILGFEASRNIINYSSPNVQYPSNVVARSNKVISLFDTCGLSRYMPTTLRGLASVPPHYAILVVGATSPFDAHEHLGLLLLLGIPLCTIITKIDSVSSQDIQVIFNEIQDVLRQAGRNLSCLRSNKNVDEALCKCLSEKHVPIFFISNVTGEGIPLVTRFLGGLNESHLFKENLTAQIVDNIGKTEFVIRDTFFVASVGCVCSGAVLYGKIEVGLSYCSGPHEDSSFIRMKVLSIHRFGRPVNAVLVGQTATLLLAPNFVSSDQINDSCKKKRHKTIRHGLVLIACAGGSIHDHGRVCAKREILAWIQVLQHHSTLRVSATAVAYCGCVRQAVRLVWMEKSEMVTGNSGKVRLRFISREEWVIPKTPLFLLQGSSTMAIGEVL